MAPNQPVRLQDNVLTIQVPSHFFYEWLEEHYIALLKKTIKHELGLPADWSTALLWKMLMILKGLLQ